MGKIKQFVKRNKSTILVTAGTIAASGILVYLAYKGVKNATIYEVDRVSTSVGTLEEVKGLMDANKDNNTAYAIFREFVNSKEVYQYLTLDS